MTSVPLSTLVGEQTGNSDERVEDSGLDILVAEILSGGKGGGE